MAAETGDRPLALITGASGGIGEAFAHVLAAEGYGLVLAARRTSELNRVAGVVTSRHDVPVFLPLNAPHYDTHQLPFILEMARRVADLGVEALIVADIGLALAVREASVPVKLHLSSLATCTNADAEGACGWRSPRRPSSSCC